MTSGGVRPWIILALIFVLGGITGSLLTITLRPHFEAGPPGPAQMGNHWMMRLTERLKLTDDQQDKIRPFVMDAEKQIVSAHHEDVAKIGKIMQDTNAKIAEVLEPDQRAELKLLESERERMFQRHMHGNHGTGDFHHSDEGDRPPGPPPETPNPPPSS